MDLPPINPPSWFSGVARIRVLLTRWLVEPSRKIHDPARRRKGRLLSFFLICLFLLFLSVNLAYLVTITSRIRAANNSIPPLWNALSPSSPESDSTI